MALYPDFQITSEDNCQNYKSNQNILSRPNKMDIIFSFTNFISITKRLKCPYNAVQYNTRMHTSLQWPNRGRTLIKVYTQKKTSHTSPPRASYGEFVYCEDLGENWPYYIPHCTCFPSHPHYFTRISVQQCHSQAVVFYTSCLPISLTHWTLGNMAIIWKTNFQTYTKGKPLQYCPWNCPQMNVTRPYWWLVNIGSGNPYPLPYSTFFNPMLHGSGRGNWHHIQPIIHHLTG